MTQMIFLAYNVISPGGNASTQALYECTRLLTLLSNVDIRLRERGAGAAGLPEGAIETKGSDVGRVSPLAVHKSMPVRWGEINL